MYDKWAAYGQSKTANILLAISLANKLGKRGLQAHSVHPGTIAGTGLASHLDMSADVALLSEFSHPVRGNTVLVLIPMFRGTRSVARQP